MRRMLETTAADATASAWNTYPRGRRLSGAPRLEWASSFRWRLLPSTWLRRPFHLNHSVDSNAKCWRFLRMRTACLLSGMRVNALT